jgi:hypothetical protein
MAQEVREGERFAPAEVAASSTVDRDTNRRSTDLPRMAVIWMTIIAAAGIASSYTLLLTLWVWRGDPWVIEVFRDHFAAMIGLPFAALLSFILVVLLEARFDSIEMEVFHGFIKFRGASGPIVLWMLCFVSIAASIRLLW